jgi:hypothetical protein
MLYVWYEAISRHFAGWTLTEIKAMPARERDYWLDLIRWGKERSSA